MNLARLKVRQLIARGLEYDGHYSVDDVLKEVFAGRADIWLGDQSVAVTSMIECPQARKFNIWVAAGEKDELINEMYPQFEQRAREHGCKSVMITGRPGWVRVMKDTGFKEVARVLAKEL